MRDAPHETDIAIIGAGIAGVSAAYELSAHKSVTLIEREQFPGTHASGRSAAVFTEIYGNELVRKLTRLSKPFFDNPPACFDDYKLLKSRGILMVGGNQQRTAIESYFTEAKKISPQVKLLQAKQIQAICPSLSKEAAGHAVYDPDACDIDVNGLIQGYLRGARNRGAHTLFNAELKSGQKQKNRWRLETEAGVVIANTVVNAAGAWVDEVAHKAGVTPLGIQPLRRSAILIDTPEGVDANDWPLVVDLEETYYFKPDAGKILVSPADETPSSPTDAQPEDIDVAIAAHRFQTATGWEPRRINCKWAGLRTFTKDRTPVAGWDKIGEGWFWLAGQGGYGIQTAPAMAQASAALIVNGGLPELYERSGITSGDLSAFRPALQRNAVPT